MAEVGSQGKSDIDGLKERFSKMQQKQSPETTSQKPEQAKTTEQTQQTSQISQQQVAPQQTQSVNSGAVQTQVSPPQTISPSQDTSNQKEENIPEGTKSPLDALQGVENQQAGEEVKPAVNVVEVEGEHNSIVGGNVVQEIGGQSQQTDSSSAIQTKNEPVSDETIIEESLEDLREEYDDAKLNSVIIEQVKELIEIDNNLNNKLEDLRVDFKKETEEREKLNKKIDNNYEELKELEKSIDKFIALYELVTNQFNPFVKQGEQGLQQKQMQNLMTDMKSTDAIRKEKQEARQASEQTSQMEAEQKSRTEQVTQSAQPAPAQQAQAIPPQVSSPQSQTDFHFETKNGLRVNTLAQLLDVIQNMSDGEFSHHVSDTKNDFATWIGSALQNSVLSQKMMSLKTKQEIIAVLQQTTTPSVSK